MVRGENPRPVHQHRMKQTGRAGARYDVRMADENGTNPATQADTPETVPVSDRLIGAIGLVIALGLAAIALDLLTGGAIARLFAFPAEGDGG